MGFNWLGFDGFYGEDPWFLRRLDDSGIIFMRCPQRSNDLFGKSETLSSSPTKAWTPPYSPQNRNTILRVDKWADSLPEKRWQRLRQTIKGWLEADFLHQRGWLWDGEEERAKHWHLIVRREIGEKQEIKYSLSNAHHRTKLKRLGQMQAQRFFIERTLQNGKSEAGLTGYQVRNWKAWHHHITMVFMTLLFMLEERVKQLPSFPLLSCYAKYF